MGRKKSSDILNSKNQSDNLISFSNSQKISETIADELLDNNDIEGALSFYLKAEKRKIDYNLYRKIANLYTELGMYRYAILYWYKFLNYAPVRLKAEAYNGLGGNYYLEGNNRIAAYYFNLQINDKGDADFMFDDLMYELFDKESPIPLEPEQPKFEIFDEQTKLDEEAMAQARENLEQYPERAKSIYNDIGQDSKYFGEAQYFLAILALSELDFKTSLNGYLQAKKYKYAESVVSTNILALSLLLDERSIFEDTFTELKASDLTDCATAVKFFTLFAGLNKHDLAYEYAKTLKELLPHNGDLHLYTAYAANNIGLYDIALDEFSKYYAITEAGYARCAKQIVSDIIDKKAKPFEMEYELGLQKCMTMNYVAILGELLEQKPSEINKNSKTIIETIVPFLSGDNPEIHAAVFHLLAIINEGEGILQMKRYLLTDRASDVVKTVVLTLLVEMGNTESLGLVFNYVYSKVPFESVEFNNECGDLFRRAYALAFGRFAPYCEREIYKLRIAAYDLYDKFLASGNIRKIKNINSLAGLMVREANIKSLRSDSVLYKYLGTTTTAVSNLNKLLGE